MQVCKTVTDLYHQTLRVDFINNLALDSIKLKFSKNWIKSASERKKLHSKYQGIKNID